MTDALATSWEDRFGKVAKEQFGRERDWLLKKVRGAQRLGKANAPAIDWQTVQGEWQDYLAQAGNDWRQAYIPLIRGVVTDEAAALTTSLGIAFDVDPVLATAAFDDYTIKTVLPIMKTTNEDVVAMLQQGTKEGWSIPKMVKGTGAIFQEYVQQGSLTDADRILLDTLPRYRLEMIARTETLRAANFGSFQLYGQAGITYKEWLATFDNRVRPDHETAGIRYVQGGNPGPIPMKEPFQVGGVRMMYPHDPSAPAEQVINCRCAIAPWKPEWGG